MFKRAPGEFDESKIRRDGDGRFAPKGGGTAPSLRQRQLVEPSPGRLFEEKWGRKGGAFAQAKPAGGSSRTSWQRIGPKVAELPPSYTGSTQRETPVDGFRRISLQPQRPKALTEEQHETIRLGLVDAIKTVRQDTIDKATERGLIPEGTDRRLLSRAYNLAAMRAMHEYGVGRLDYEMSDQLKQDMEPLVPAMRYFQRRVGNEFRSRPGTRGAWQAYKEEFGIPYADRRLDRRPGKGNQLRLRWQTSHGSHTGFIKATMPGELAKAAAARGLEPELAIAAGLLRATLPGRAAPAAAQAPAAVRAVLPLARRVLRRAEALGHAAVVDPRRRRHLATETVIADPQHSLADLLR